MVLLTQVNVDSIDCSSYVVSWEYEKSAGELVSVIKVRFVRTVLDVVSLATGQSVSIYRGVTTATDSKIFDGYVEKYEPDTGLITVTAKDKLWDLVRREVNTVYELGGATAGKISDIFIDLVTTYGGLTADGTSVQDSGDVYVLEKFVCYRTDVMERCKKLADALDWQFYYRADTDKVYFEPKGFSVSSSVLTVGSDVVSIPKWSYDNTEMVNDLTIVGAVQEVETTESGQIGVTAGYTTTGITIGNIPSSVKVYSDANTPPTTLQVGGVPDTSSSYFYYVDKSQKKIMPASGTTFTTNHYAQINYSYFVPVPVNVYDDPSIAAYGRFSKTITFKDVKSVIDAEVRGVNYLTKYSSPFVYASLRVKLSSSVSLSAGTKIRVVDSKSRPSVDSWLVINRIVMNFPGTYDEVYVGDKEWRLAEWQAKIEENIKRLQETEENSEIVVQIINANNTLGQQIEVKPRYSKIVTQTYNTTNKILILDHPTYSVLDDVYNWGTEALAFDDSTTFVMQYDNNYVETFVDDDFKSGSTTATWSADSLSFAASQVGQSESIDKGNGTITGAILTPDFACEVAWLKFNSDVLDSSLNGYDGANTDATFSLGKINYCGVFNGSSAYVTIADNANLDLIQSVSFWVNLTRQSDNYNRILFCKSNTYYPGLTIKGLPQQIWFYPTTSGDYVSFTGWGVWHHVVLTIEDSGGNYYARIYLDGVATKWVDANSYTLTLAAQYPFNNANSGYIMGGAANRWVSGSMDDLRVYKHKLSATEVSALYNSGLGTESLLNDNGNFTLQLSADGGSHWETVSGGVVHSFTYTGADLRWKITEAAGGVGVITGLEVSDYH